MKKIMENENVYKFVCIQMPNSKAMHSFIHNYDDEFQTFFSRKLQMNEKLFFSRIYFAFMFVYLRDH